MSQASSTGMDGDHWLPHQTAAPSAPGLPVLIRQVVADDRPALAEMLARCSDQTREQRFHKYVPCFPEPYLAEALDGRAAHFALLAQAGQAVVALASCVATGRGSGELALLVEDSWQRLGVGGRLLSLLIAHADQSGLARLEAWVLASRDRGRGTPIVLVLRSARPPGHGHDVVRRRTSMADLAPAPLPAPPYYAVVFTSVRTAGDKGYGKRAEQMLKLAATSRASSVPIRLEVWMARRLRCRTGRTRARSPSGGITRGTP